MTTTDTRPPTDQRKLGLVGTAVEPHIRELQRGYREDRADAVSAVARIRRGAGRSVAEAVDLWGVTGMERLYQEQALRGAAAEEAENAFHAAITLWALHQQAHRESGMHRRGGWQLGGAVRRLMPTNDIDEAVRMRFVRLGSSSSFDLLSQRLREIVLLLRRGDGIPLDYGVLADQLFQWQRPDGRTAVRRAWGHSFHAAWSGDQASATGTSESTSADPTDPTDPTASNSTATTATATATATADKDAS
ncbi:type I-E CRISPR-associated protein Cse2/CasB [Kitasatospora sp. NBC_01287]|uniref:type I-E CRISPR-associated protein Cse2/CasB n=1 Tax=Kitasatospora sp. NBC_01287 TaxID=2903573 RepID=UPI00225AB1DD|nr:type I-E CRISPR-associated protein Cse2/CasB [Kitasatospora sp. NBC_01287]MCX4744807.1 type I-E CRISPR-associated protein Cse2/CasB [Kitasatospora sp. NBC_01287]